MNFFLQNKQYTFLLGGLLLVVFFVLILAYALLRPVSTPSPSFENISPTPFPSLQPTATNEQDPYSPAYKQSVKEIRQEEKSLLEQDKKVALFIDTLPQQGTNFTAKYDIDTNSVTVTIPSSKSLEGEKEFDEYLVANGIQNRSWIQNLTVRFRNIDPDEH